MAVIQCPCKCGRRLRLTRPDLFIVRERWRYELTLAQRYDVPVAIIRHVRSIPDDVFEACWRGELAAEAS